MAKVIIRSQSHLVIGTQASCVVIQALDTSSYHIVNSNFRDLFIV